MYQAEKRAQLWEEMKERGGGFLDGEDEKKKMKKKRNETLTEGQENTRKGAVGNERRGLRHREDEKVKLCCHGNWQF